MLKGNNTKKQHAKKQQLKKQHAKKHRQKSNISKKSNSIIWVTRYRPTVMLPADIDQLNFDTY